VQADGLPVSARAPHPINSWVADPSLVAGSRNECDRTVSTSVDGRLIYRAHIREPDCYLCGALGAWGSGEADIRFRDM